MHILDVLIQDVHHQMLREWGIRTRKIGRDALRLHSTTEEASAWDT